MSLILFGILLPWLFLGLGCWLGYQLLRQNGRLLLHLEALDQRLSQLPALAPSSRPAPSPEGLPLGSVAPDFELSDLAGGRKTLADFRGRRLLLIFFNPRCGFCTQMAGDLAALPTEKADGRPMPLVITTGSTEENRKLVAQHGIPCPVLRQEQMEVAARYQVQGTPTGYLIDEQGHIASELAIGSQALLALAGPTAAPSPAAASAHGHPAHRGNRDLAESKIDRKGLPAGTRAPDVTVPALDGGTLSLQAYRGQGVLLVFSDPQCGPCQQLMPELEQYHRRTGEVQVLMVSRGEVAANQAKAAEHGLTFPIGLQKQWEISRQYAMFATPIAYLINAEGVIAEPVAVGVAPIQALLARMAGTTSAARGHGESVPAERRCACGTALGECGCARKNGHVPGAKPREKTRAGRR